MSQVVQVERERESRTDKESHIHNSDSTRSNSGNGGSTNPNGRILQGEVLEAPAEMVADGDGGRELLLLDRELLSGEAAYTHTAGRQMLVWWMWMLRSPTEMNERNPTEQATISKATVFFGDILTQTDE